MRQNLGWASAYNLLAIPVAAGVLFPSLGLELQPQCAALLMSVSSIALPPATPSPWQVLEGDALAHARDRPGGPRPLLLSPQSARPTTTAAGPSTRVQFAA
jgi:hypothetical protein